MVRPASTPFSRGAGLPPAPLKRSVSQPVQTGRTTVLNTRFLGLQDRDEGLGTKAYGAEPAAGKRRIQKLEGHTRLPSAVGMKRRSPRGISA